MAQSLRFAWFTHKEQRQLALGFANEGLNRPRVLLAGEQERLALRIDRAETAKLRGLVSILRFVIGRASGLAGSLLRHTSLCDGFHRNFHSLA